MNDKKQIAQHLYMAQGKTQKEIALEVGVSERTIYTWVHQYAWDKMRLAAYQAPATISENLCSQLVEMQNAIASRQPGVRYPDPKEAEVIRKLVLSVETMKKYPSLSQNMQMLETFRNYVRPLNKHFTKQLAHYADRFLTEKSISGFAPYQMEYGIEQVAPVAPFYDELEEDQPCDKDNPPEYPVPCTHVQNCLHPGSCTYPHCKRETLYKDDSKPEATGRNPAISPIVNSKNGSTSGTPNIPPGAIHIKTVSA